MFSWNLGFLLLAFGAAELYLRSRGFDPYFRFLPGWPVPEGPTPAAYVEADPVLGWVSSRESKEINAQGFRDVDEYTAPDPARADRRLMVLGDSFLWGVGVLRRESIPGRLDTALPEVDVFNLATPGWGIDQMYLAFQQYVPVLDPHIVLLGFIDNDIARVLEAHRPWEGLSKPVLTMEKGHLVRRTSSSPLEIWRNRIAAKSVLLSRSLRQLSLTYEARPLVRQIFRELLRDAEANGRRLVVVHLPTNGGPRTSHDDFRALFEETDHGLYLDAFEALHQEPGWPDDHYLDNGHFTKAGNRIVTEFLLREAFGEERPAETPEPASGVRHLE